MTTERRTYPRVSDDNVALQLKIDQFDVITHTLNISASGVYCKISNQLPLMSKVKLVLIFPDPGGAEDKRKTIDVTGVVVREHPVIINGEVKHYDVAIFFDSLSAHEKEMISQYVAGRLK